MSRAGRNWSQTHTRRRRVCGRRSRRPGLDIGPTGGELRFSNLCRSITDEVASDGAPWFNAVSDGNLAGWDSVIAPFLWQEHLDAGRF